MCLSAVVSSSTCKANGTPTVAWALDSVEAILHKAAGLRVRHGNLCAFEDGIIQQCRRPDLWGTAAARVYGHRCNDALATSANRSASPHPKHIANSHTASSDAIRCYIPSYIPIDIAAASDQSLKRERASKACDGPDIASRPHEALRAAAGAAFSSTSLLFSNSALLVNRHLLAATNVFRI